MRAAINDDPERARADVVEAIEQCAGNLRRAHHRLCISRRSLYRMVWELDLWPVIDAVRAKPVVALGLWKTTQPQPPP